MKRLVAGPKPPIRARVFESSPDGDREASVIHDGLDGRCIIEGAKVELTSTDSTTIVDTDRFEAIRGMGVASNNWVKSLIQGRRTAYLPESTGRVVDSTDLEDRPCWVVDVNGLRLDEPEVPIRLWVDTETGIILREERIDIEAMVELRDVEIGEVVQSAPNAPR